MRIGASLWTPSTDLIGKFHSRPKQGGRRGKGGENRGEERRGSGEGVFITLDMISPKEMILMANVADFFRLLLLRPFLDTENSQFKNQNPKHKALEGSTVFG